MNNYITNLDLKINSRRNLMAMISSFLIGVTISSIPHIINLVKDIRNEKAIHLEKLAIRKEMEDKCKGIGSGYEKFQNLGFPITAKEEFNICMQKGGF